MKKTYYYCDEDNMGQRVGTVSTIKLHKKDTELDRFGNRTYNGIFLYDEYVEALMATQD